MQQRYSFWGVELASFSGRGAGGLCQHASARVFYRGHHACCQHQDHVWPPTFAALLQVQMIALTRGVWVSQRQARLLGSDRDMTDDVIFDGRTEDTGVKRVLRQPAAFGSASAVPSQHTGFTTSPSLSERAGA